MKLQLLLKLYSIILVNIYEKYNWNFNIEINTIITIVLIYIWKFKYKYHKYNKIIQYRVAASCRQEQLAATNYI